MKDKIIILHVFDDEKFFDATSRFFDTLNNVSNKYYFYTPNKNYTFQRIKSIEKITIFNDYNKYRNQFSSNEVDIIYFHSLYPNKYKLFNHISDDKIVIWWCFGAEIYYGYKGLKPLIDLNLYKPLTSKVIKEEEKHLSYKKKLKEFFKQILSFHFVKEQNKVLNRIDYFSPVLPIEYELMKSNPNFHAKPFMLNSGPGLYTPKPLPTNRKAHNILIGNSLTYTNNHLDIFDILNHIQITPNRNYIIPISYGLDFSKNKEFLKSSLQTKQVIWLEDFIPFKEYISYLDSITHAVFGQIRQQAIGNINFCFERGIKIYLYSDSIIYKQFKKMGYIVYTIENDLTSDSLNEVLDEKSAKHNYELFCNAIKDRVITANIELMNITKFN